MPNSVRSTPPDYDFWAEVWQRCRDFSSGEDAVKKAGEEHLPRLDGQSNESYSRYLKAGYLYNATGRTRQGFVGMIMRKPPNINLPPGLVTHQEDVDQKNTTLLEFAESLVREEMTTARSGVLVDYPADRPGELSQADAEALNLRSYAIFYSAENILRVRKKRVNNIYKPVQIRLLETDEEEIDAFETKEVERVRVLELTDESDVFPGRLVYQQRLFNQVEDQWEEDIDQRRIPRINGQPLVDIPFVFLGDDAFREPPILDLVNANKQHYVHTVDYNAGLRWTTRPQPYVTGEEEDNLKGVGALGTGELWIGPNPETKFGMLEYTGTGLSAVEKKLDKVEEHMAALGARMLAPEKRMAETAEAHIIKRQGENSALGLVAQHVSRGLTEIYQWFARWEGLPDIGISVLLNTDFVPVEMTAEEVLKWTQALQTGAIMPEDFYYALSQGEVLDPSISNDLRITRWQTQPPPGI